MLVKNGDKYFYHPPALILDPQFLVPMECSGWHCGIQGPRYPMCHKCHVLDKEVKQMIDESKNVPCGMGSVCNKEHDT